MQEDELIMGLDQDALNPNRSSSHFVPEHIELFYNKLGEYNSNWRDLEDITYKCTRISRFHFVRDIKQMTQTPDLQFYKIAISRNGGPVAFLLMDNTFFIGSHDNTKNIVFIFSSFGELI